jgi:hypothetical protein
MLSVPPLNVAAPLDPVVVSVNGAPHVALPFQTVVADAPVPLFSFVTGMFPMLIVPLVVNVPPVIGDVVDTLVTVPLPPLPATAAQCPLWHV